MNEWDANCMDPAIYISPLCVISWHDIVSYVSALYIVIMLSLSEQLNQELNRKLHC